MRDTIVLVMKGFFMGLAKIIPGLSGSLLAVSFGVYEQGIEAISQVWRNPKKYLPFLGIAGIGILIGIMVGSRLIFYFFSHFYLQTMLLFLGLIVGTLPILFQEHFLFNKKNIVIFIGIFLLFFLVSFQKETPNFTYQFGFKHNLYLVVLGFIDAATMIIPGVSGTAVFLLLGCYNFILVLFSHLPFFFSYLPFYFFGVGLLFGIYFVSRWMNYMFHSHLATAYALITSFACSSSVLLLMTLFKGSYDGIQWIWGLSFFFLGYFVSKKFG